MMLLQSNRYLYSKYLLFSLFSLIYFQQVFVLKFAGGNIKSYEAAGLLIVLTFLLCSPFYLTRQLTYLFIFFIVSPVISDIIFLLFADISGYYKRFPEAVYSLRCNKVFTVIFSLVLSVSSFCIAQQIVTSEFLYKSRDKAVKIFIVTGSIIALYALYQFIGIAVLGLPDVIPSFIDARNNKIKRGWFRVLGFGDEPGTYVIIQTLCVYYLLLYKRLFKKNTHLFLCVLNFIVMLLTVSSSLLISMSGFLLYSFLSKKRKLKILMLLIVILLLGILYYFNDISNGAIQGIFITKVTRFFKPPHDTLGSGSMRAYTTGLGLKVFHDNLLFGSGFGCSNFFLYKYEYSLGIKAWGERLTALVYPQSGHSKILAEQGLFGYSSFILFYLSTLMLFYKNRKYEFVRVHLIIAISLFLFNFVIQPITNLFMWLNIYPGLNYIYYKHKLKEI